MELHSREPQHSARALCGAFQLEAEALITLMGQDKKVIDGRLRFILARGGGEAFVAEDVPGDQVHRPLTDALSLRK